MSLDRGSGRLSYPEFERFWQDHKRLLPPPTIPTAIATARMAGMDGMDGMDVGANAITCLLLWLDASCAGTVSLYRHAIPAYDTGIAATISHVDSLRQCNIRNLLLGMPPFH